MERVICVHSCSTFMISHDGSSYICDHLHTKENKAAIFVIIFRPRKTKQLYLWSSSDQGKQSCYICDHLQTKENKAAIFVIIFRPRKTKQHLQVRNILHFQSSVGENSAAGGTFAYHCVKHGQYFRSSDWSSKLISNIQSIPKRCIHIIIRNINLVYTSFWDTLCLKENFLCTDTKWSYCNKRTRATC
jgi:hypothetical protein